MTRQRIDVEMLELFKAELTLCKVREGEVVAVLSGDEEQSEYAQTFMLAARSLGATTFHLNVPKYGQSKVAGQQGRHALTGNQPAIDTLKRVDMVIDLLGLLFSREQLEIQEAGTRILRVMEPFHILKKMFPTEDLRRRTELSRTLLQSARTMRITSPGGTDVTYGLKQYPVISEYGYTDEPGRWDHFPSGFAFTQATDGDVNGTVVLMPGDILCAFKRYIQSPVTLTIKDGYIVDLEGEGTDATLIRSYIDSFGDPRGWAISHIGWGSNERADWHHIAASQQLASEHIMNALSFYGNVLFSTGPNTELGGTNDTPCHLDIPLRGCSLWLDDVHILDEGEFAYPELRTPGR
ncbi:leucyl aminopeptidase [Bradyrhizobium sp. B120]|uniref:leucyl aminopeptidase n=1 Tax=Bradyrhizobium sp. B120 TaxID=3410088 RepID=UPI003B97D21B